MSTFKIGNSLSKSASIINRIPQLGLYFQNNVFMKKFHQSSIYNVEGTPIKMPSLSPTMMEGCIIKWMKKEGDSVQPGDVLCDIQTDKAVISFEVEEEGILAKILLGDNSTDVKIGTLIALMVGDGEDWKNVEVPKDVNPNEEKETAFQSKPESSKTTDFGHFGPSVRLLLEKYGLTADLVPAQGPHGILLKGDVLKLVKEKNLSPKEIQTVLPPVVTSTAPSSILTTLPSREKPVKLANMIKGYDLYEDIELSNMRKTIAKRLTQSKSNIAHTYSTFECKLDEILALRKQFKAKGISVSVNDFLIKACSVALTRCPEINCVWENGQVVHKQNVDISVAVSTKAGLITPIVKGVENLGIESISETVRDLASRARDNKLKLDEFQGGTFTISNLGMFGIREFTAIINPPQCAILAVGGGNLTIGLDDDKLETRMRATLSYDQAAVSDDTAAIFLSTLKEILEDPGQILLGSYRKHIDHEMAALL